MKIKIVRVTVKIRDAWIGVFWRTYRRRAILDPIPIATDFWICLIPFLKFQIRITHTKMTHDEESAINEEREVL